MENLYLFLISFTFIFIIYLIVFLIKMKKRKLKKFFYKRIPMNKEYYKDNELLKSVYEYFDKLIKFYY